MGKHSYTDAFCLMWYACTCGHQEQVYNSRDGVTPSATICSSCGDMARHVPNLDEYAPQHELNHGQKFFRDGTEEEAYKIICRRLKVGSISDFDSSKYGFQVGWPCVDIFGHLREY